MIIYLLVHCRCFNERVCGDVGACENVELKLKLITLIKQRKNQRQQTTNDYVWNQIQENVELNLKLMILIINLQ